MVKIIRNIIHKAIIIILLITYNNTAKVLEWCYKNKGNKKKIRPLKDLVPIWRNKYIIIIFELLPTPPNTLIKCLFTTALITAMPKNTPSKNLLNI